MGIETTSLFDKFKAGNLSQIQQNSTPQQQIKLEEKKDEVTLSTKPKKTTAHYAGVGAGIGALVGIAIPVIGFTLAGPLYLKAKSKVPFLTSLKGLTEIWRSSLVLTGISEAICLDIGLSIGAITGLIKNRKKDL